MAMPMTSGDGRERPAPYTLVEHRHRFAGWAAARGVQRGWSGAKTELLVEALTDSGVSRQLTGEHSALPRSATEFDTAHRQWCREIVAYLNTNGVDTTYGRAAKLVAVYLKAMVVAGPDSDSRLARIAHPPVDKILLDALARDGRFTTDTRRMWRQCTWTSLSEAAYFDVIASFRSEGLDRPAFWAVERYWRPR